MRKMFLVVCVALFYSLSLFAAPSTEGKEFWVAFTLGRAAEDRGDEFALSLRISSKQRGGTVTVTNPITGYFQTYQIPYTGLLEITNIPYEQWYPYDANVQGQQRASGQFFNTGLKVTSTVDVSVFATIRYRYGMDASNILPITAIQNEYVIQDYPPYANGSPSTSYSNFCILATEDNTQVEITPRANTYDGKLAGVPYTITLNAGQVYYVVSERSTDNGKYSEDSHLKSLSGSYVYALNNKKIAVFNGDICTRVPNGASARDILYEQAIPIDYWGTEFVVTRSLEKDANRIRITALVDDTEIKLDGYTFTTLNARETIEIELAVAEDVKGHDLPLGYQFIQDVMYIEATCPIAVYNYDTGNSCASKTASEIFSGYGDPSMTWVNPLKQRIQDITFSTLHTTGTNRHFINIVAKTSDIHSVELCQVVGGSMSNNIISSADFITIPAKPEYSYARVALSISSRENQVFNLRSNEGIIAHIYGNGDDESYAYSVGSSAVKRTISLNGMLFPDNAFVFETVCANEIMYFDGEENFNHSDESIVESITWNFGDGTPTVTEARTEHIYTKEGIYRAYCYVTSTNPCTGRNTIDSLAIEVHVGKPTMQIDSTVVNAEGTELYCYYSSSHYNLTDILQVTFDDAATKIGLTAESVLEKTTDYVRIAIPEGLSADQKGEDNVYGIQLEVDACGAVVCNDTFYIPANKVATSTDNLTHESLSGVQKVFENNTLYILKPTGECFTIDGRKVN